MSSQRHQIRIGDLTVADHPGQLRPTDTVGTPRALRWNPVDVTQRATHRRSAMLGRVLAGGPIDDGSGLRRSMPDIGVSADAQLVFHNT
jgi:hypothetical protein